MGLDMQDVEDNLTNLKLEDEENNEALGSDPEPYEDEGHIMFPVMAVVIRVTPQYAVVQPLGDCPTRKMRIGGHSTEMTGQNGLPAMFDRIKVYDGRPSRMEGQMYRVLQYEQLSAAYTPIPRTTIVAVTKVVNDMTVKVVGAGFPLPTIAHLSRDYKKTLSSTVTEQQLLVGHAHQMPPYFEPTLHEGRIYYRMNDDVAVEYDGYLEEWETEMRMTGGGGGGEYLRELRPLGGEMEEAVMTKARGKDLDMEEAELIIRDPMIARQRLTEHVDRVLAIQHTSQVYPEYLQANEWGNGMVKVEVDMDREQTDRCIKTKGQLSWRVGTELHLRHPLLTRFGNSHSVSLEIENITFYTHGGVRLRLTVCPVSELLMKLLLSADKVSNQPTKCLLGPQLESPHSLAQVIEDNFAGFFYNREIFLQWCGCGLAPPESKKEEMDGGVLSAIPLDLYQYSSLQTAISTPGICCVAAPPGTGKTHLISAIVAARSLSSSASVRFGVSATTNVAVTNAIDAIHRYFPDQKVCREFSVKAVTTTSKPSLTLSLREMAKEAKKHVDVEEHPQLNAAIMQRNRAARILDEEESKSLSEGLSRLKTLRRLENEMTDLFLDAYGPVALGSTSALLSRRPLAHIDHLILDEAAQMSSTEALALLCTMPNLTHITLLGDSKQLGPHCLLDPESQAFRLAGQGELARLESLPTVTHTRLNTVYRCHPLIVQNWLCPIYGYDMNCGVSEVERGLAATKGLPVARDGTPCLLVHMDGSDGQFGVNEKEIEEAVKLIRRLKNAHIGGQDVAVICHHKAQRERLIVRLRGDGNIGYHRLPVTIHTVDSFQGKEAKAVIVLTTKTANFSLNVPSTLQFIADPQRETVAISRAQHLMYIFADWESLFQTCFWKRFKHLVARSGALVNTNFNHIRPMWMN